MSSETMVRDQLALDRTLLANERTLLAYIRTALALIGAGAGGGLVFRTPVAWWAGGMLIMLGPVTAAIGLHHFRAVRAKLCRLQAELNQSVTTANAEKAP